MPTECSPKLFVFEAVERRSVVAGFDGGDITSNAGGLLLGQVDRGVGLVLCPSAVGQEYETADDCQAACYTQCSHVAPPP